MIRRHNIEEKRELGILTHIPSSLFVYTEIIFLKIWEFFIRIKRYFLFMKKYRDA